MTNSKRSLLIPLIIHVGFMLILVSYSSSPTLAKSGHAPNIETLSGKFEQQSARGNSDLFSEQQEQAVLVRTIDASQFSPPSTDPTGITFLKSTATLIMSDSEVDETMHFSGTNVFVVDLSGALVDTWSTLAFSEEPTAVIVNPDNGHLFVADDNAIKMAAADSGASVNQVHPGPEVTEIDPGPDQLYFTEDDVISFLPTESFGSSDPEGLAYDPEQKHLLVLDDTTHQIYEISPGANGIFDGLVPEGDDHVATYDLSYLEMTQIKGITYRPMNGHLYFVGRPKTQIVETTITGRLVRMIDISVISTTAPSDLVFAPSSLDPDTVNLYVTDRGVDNNSDPTENDGRIYEIALPTVPSSNNTAPTVDAGTSVTVVSPMSVTLLNGSVTDDGLPIPPGKVETSWSQVQGPTNVIFSDASQVDTSVTITEVGVYVLRLRADDGEATASDLVTVTVAQAGTQVNLPPTVEAGATQNVTVGQVITMTGIITDDGLPEPPGVVSSIWTLFSGPDGGTVVDPDALTTQVTVAEPGEYVVRLTANDGEYEIHDDVLLQVLDSDPDPEPDSEPETGSIFLPFVGTD